MATDDERREVARRLRAIDPDDFSSYSEEHECVEKALGIWDDFDKFLWHVVADLIEPHPTCRFYDPEDDMCLNVRAARPCGREALLELADDLDRMGDGSMYDASISDEYGIARRIRWALGAER